MAVLWCEMYPMDDRVDVDINFCSRGCFSNLFLLSNLTVVVVVVVVVGVIHVAGEEKEEEEEEEEEELKALRLRASALRANDRAFLRIVVVFVVPEKEIHKVKILMFVFLRDDDSLFFYACFFVSVT